MDRSHHGLRSPLGSHESLPFTPPSSEEAQLTPDNNTTAKLPEPKSELLRNILKEKRAGRRTSPAPRRPSMSSSRSTYTGDEWTTLSESETPVPTRTTPRRRPHHPRRASLADVPCRTPAQAKQMTVKETNDLITKLQNENFDVKLRLTLTQERVIKLEKEVQTMKVRSERVEQLEERNTELEDQVARLQERLDALTKEKDALDDQHQEDLSINDTLVKELEERDIQLHERDSAVEEAATLIDQLQRENDLLKKSKMTSRSPTIHHQSSDYFSSEAESQPIAKVSPQPSTSDIAGSRPSTAPGSDYFSVASSPRPPPRTSTPRPLSRRQGSITRVAPYSPSSKSTASTGTTPSVTHHPQNLQTTSSLMDARQAMDLIASADKIRRPLTYKKRNSPGMSGPNPHPAAAAAVAQYHPHRPSPESTRPLRNLYLSGELGRRIDTSGVTGAPPPVPVHRDFRSISRATSTSGSVTPEESPTASSLASSLPQLRSSLDQDEQRAPSEVSVASDSTVSFHPNMGFSSSLGGLAGLHNLRQPRAYPPWPLSNSMLARDFLFNPHVDDFGVGSRRKGAR